MIKISVNLRDADAQLIDRLAEDKRLGSKSDIIRTAIHEYCEKITKQQDQLLYAVDQAYGAFKDAPIDPNELRNDSNESGRL